MISLYHWTVLNVAWICFQEVAEKTTELEMELMTAKKSMQKLQGEKERLQQELLSAAENKTGLEESLNQLTEVKARSHLVIASAIALILS